MVLNRVLEPHIIGTVGSTVFRRHLCEWVLPQEVATKVSYNPRQLPVPVRRPDNEDYLLPLHIRQHITSVRQQRFFGFVIKQFGDQTCASSASLLPLPTLK